MSPGSNTKKNPWGCLSVQVHRGKGCEGTARRQAFTSPARACAHAVLPAIVIEKHSILKKLSDPCCLLWQPGQMHKNSCIQAASLKSRDLEEAAKGESRDTDLSFRADQEREKERPVKPMSWGHRMKPTRQAGSRSHPGRRRWELTLRRRSRWCLGREELRREPKSDWRGIKRERGKKANRKGEKRNASSF